MLLYNDFLYQKIFVYKLRKEFVFFKYIFEILYKKQYNQSLF